MGPWFASHGLICLESYLAPDKDSPHLSCYYRAPGRVVDLTDAMKNLMYSFHPILLQFLKDYCGFTYKETES